MDIRQRLADRLRHLVAPSVETGPHHASVIAVASGKGGVGKTTSAVNLAVGYAQLKRATLLIDLDPQAHVGAALGWQPPAGAPSVSSVLAGRRRDLTEVALPSEHSCLSIAAADRDLAEVETMVAAKIGKEMLLKEALATARSRFEIIIIDCPPNLGTLALNALCAADHLLVPTDMSMLAFEGVLDIVEALSLLRSRLHQAASLAGIFCTRYDARLGHNNRRLLAQLSEAFGEQVLQTRIPQVAAVNRALLAGRPLLVDAPRSPAAVAYRNLACEVAARVRLNLGQSAQPGGAATDPSLAPASSHAPGTYGADATASASP